MSVSDVLLTTVYAHHNDSDKYDLKLYVNCLIKLNYGSVFEEIY